MEQQIIDTIKTLPVNAQQELLHFAEFLAQKYQTMPPEEVEVDEKGWPLDFFEKTAGAWAGEPLVRPPQGEFEERDPLL